MAPIGEDGELGREEYLKISIEGSKSFLNDDFESPTDFGHRTLGLLVIKKATMKLKELGTQLLNGAMGSPGG